MSHGEATVTYKKVKTGKTERESNSTISIDEEQFSSLLNTLPDRVDVFEFLVLFLRGKMIMGTTFWSITERRWIHGPISIYILADFIVQDVFYYRGSSFFFREQLYCVYDDEVVDIFCVIVRWYHCRLCNE